MITTAVVSITGPDQVGLISAITGRLFDLGADLGDTSFGVLNGTAEFTAICTFTSDMDFATLKSELADLPETRTAKIDISPVEVSTPPLTSEAITHTITISGGDCPGLMARLCEVFQHSGANIVRMNSERVLASDHSQYVISAFVSIPVKNEHICLTTVTSTAGELGLTCHWEKIVP